MDKVVVGIFWVIKGQVYFKMQEKEIDNSKNQSIIDSDYGHFYEWDNLCAKLYPLSDFATFPRGRVLYDIQNQINVVYVDKCISKTEINKIVKIFNLKTYQIKHDEHYSCDKCVGDIF